jgi:predicted lipoprotein with Yx(FWY)xxD motif
MVLAVSAALAVSLAACGKDSKPVTSAGSGQSSATTAAAAPVVTTAAPKPTVGTAASATLGTVMVDPATGKTLYTRDSDPAGGSSCTANCAATWPPLVLPGGTTAPVAGTGLTGLTAAARPDDATKMQVLWNGKALYTYSADTAAGDTKGDGVGGIWHAARPA